MNDRLGDLKDDIPAWAKEEVSSPTLSSPSSPSKAIEGDIELGNMNKQSWVNDEEDFFNIQPSSSKQQKQQQQQQEQKQQIDTESDKLMQDFYQNVDVVSETIKTITEVTKRIKEIQEQNKFAIVEAEEKKLSEESKVLIQRTNAKAKNAKTILGLLRDENNTFKNDKKQKKVKASDLRIRENLVNTMTRKFIDEMKEYQNAQQSYKVSVQNKAVQQIRYVKEDATPEEVQQILTSEGGRESLIQQHIYQGGVNREILDTYQRVSGKYQDILALERSVAELHQMFLDFALLTEQQGELIDQIEFNVKSAADHVEDANVDVYRAIEHQKSARKKSMWILIIAAILIVVLLFSFKVIP